MGKLMQIESGLVRPSQNFLKSDTVTFIANCYKNQTLDKLPPAPIVRVDPKDGSLVAIDGHNLLAVNAALDRPTEVYVADDDRDLLAGEDPGIIKRNEDLKSKFDEVIKLSADLKNEGINTIKDLCEKADIKNLI